VGKVTSSCLQFSKMGRHAGVASIPSYDTEKHDQCVIIPCSSNYNLFRPWGADFKDSCQPNEAKFYEVSNHSLTHQFLHQALYTAATILQWFCW